MKLINSILCDSLETFRAVLKKLSKMGYIDGRAGQVGANIDTYGISQYHFDKCGIRVINLYDNKKIKYAATDKKLKNVIKAIEFLKV